MSNPLRSILKFGAACLTLALLLRGWWAWQAVREQRRQEEVHPLRGITVDYILTPEQTAGLGTLPGNEFDVDGDGHVLMSNENGLLEIAFDQKGVQVYRLAEKAPDSFSLDGQGSFLSVTGQYFGQLENGGFSQVVPLPYKRMRLMGSSLPGVAYLIGGEEESAHRVYAYFADGTLQIEAEIPERVVAVSDNRSAVYLASRHNLFRVTSTAMEVVARLPEGLGDIVSIAVAPDDQALYFATERETFVMSGLSVIAVVQDLGGTIRMRNGILYVWSPVRRILISLSGIQGLIEKERGTQ